jgi:hypothetical protein
MEKGPQNGGGRLTEDGHGCGREDKEGGGRGKGGRRVLKVGRVKLGTFRMWIAWKRERGAVADEASARLLQKMTTTLGRVKVCRRRTRAATVHRILEGVLGSVGS